MQKYQVMYGLRRSKRKTEEIIKCLKKDSKDATANI